MEADFSGYVTKAGLKCCDGRTITAEAFKLMHGKKVPLVWQHVHNEPMNVLGHVMLEARNDGVYGYGFFNETPNATHAKKMVQHEDIKSMSIYANELKEHAKTVLHGVIREVSLVLSGANPGALIDFVRIAHSSDPLDDVVCEDEAVIHTGLALEVSEPEIEAESEEEKKVSEEVVHAAPNATVQDVIDSMNDDQQNVLYYMVAAAKDNASSGTAAHSENNEGDLTHKEGNGDMSRNVFEQNDAPKVEQHTLSHADVKGIVANAMKVGSLKDAVEAYAIKHGIDDIDVLFPDARNLENTPQFKQRRTEWVQGVLGDTSHTPFSRVKTVVADITQDEARAMGYIKGNYKKTEWFGLTKRTTTPTTIYKKQQLDRDDVIDITDFDVVAWLKMEMRAMLEEEIARAILISDGRDVSSEDKIKDPIGASDGVGLRSILNDHELFVTTINVNVDDVNSTYDEVVDAIMDGMEYYKGTGTPTFYTTIRTLNKFFKAKDTTNRRYYNTKAEVAAALGVKDIVTVDPMNNEPNLVGIVVNLADYNIGADKGGEVNMFDDFDIDYNLQKYLIETRLSGALTKIKSAVVIKKTAATNVLVDPPKPTFAASTGVVTIPTKTGVIYKNDSGTTLTAGAQTALTPGNSLTVNPVPDAGYYFANYGDAPWTFTRPRTQP